MLRKGEAKELIAKMRALGGAELESRIENLENENQRLILSLHIKESLEFDQIAKILSKDVSRIEEDYLDAVRKIAV